MIPQRIVMIPQARWTTTSEMQHSQHKNDFVEQEEEL